MNGLFERFTSWHFKHLQWFMPVHKPRRYTVKQAELRLKKLTIIAIVIGVGLAATVATAVIK